MGVKAKQTHPVLEGLQRGKAVERVGIYSCVCPSSSWPRALALEEQLPGPLLHASLQGGCVDPEASELVLAKGWDGDDL